MMEGALTGLPGPSLTLKALGLIVTRISRPLKVVLQEQGRILVTCLSKGLTTCNDPVSSYSSH